MAGKWHALEPGLVTQINIYVEVAMLTANQYFIMRVQEHLERRVLVLVGMQVVVVLGVMQVRVSSKERVFQTRIDVH